MEASPTCAEGAAMLGLLYCHTGGPADRAKGLELLKRVQERVGSRFVSETIKLLETAEQNRSEARDAYFQAFQEYLRSSNVSRTEREKMRDEMMKRMKGLGKEKVFIGRRGFGLDDEREREPTPTEYIARAAMLREKLAKIGPQSSAHENEELQKLVAELEKKAQDLQQHAQGVLEAQKKLMEKAQALLFN